MEVYSHIINKYGDHIVKMMEGVWQMDLRDILKQYNSEEGWIFHVRFNDHVEFLPDDVSYVASSTDRHGVIRVFANAKAIEKSPSVTENGTTSGSVFVSHISFNGDEFVLFVKDRTKEYLTNPSGSRDIGEEFIDCAVRECQEETSLVFDKNQVLEFGSFDYTAWSFDLQWPGESKIFYSGVREVSEEEINRVKRFECDEIESVVLIPVNGDDIDWDSVKGNLSTHHKVCAEFAVSSGERGTDWSGIRYLENFVLRK